MLEIAIQIAGSPYVLLVLLLILTCVVGARADEQTSTLSVWAVDPLIKVFRDSQPGPSADAIADVARGEVASLQVVVRCDKPIKGLTTKVGKLALRDGGREYRLKDIRVRFVGYVQVSVPLPNPPADRLRTPPADFPDPLLEDPAIDVQAGQAQPVWITIPIPEKARPGTYRGELVLTGEVEGTQVTAAAPISVRVWDVRVGKSRLWVTNWFSVQWAHMAINPEPDSPEYWDLVRRYARSMVEHRQNVVLTQTLNLVRFEPGENGVLSFGFSDFDKWVNVFTNEGAIGRIEGGHFGGRAGDWYSPFVMRVKMVEDGKIVEKSMAPTEPAADAFYAQFLPALVKHLEEKGWLDKYCQHLGDEPIPENAHSYRAMAALVHEYAPQLKIIEACHTKDLVGAIDIWVPQLDFFHRDYGHYQERQKSGEEVWFYTCVYPQGEYANRFIELPLIKTRLLHWIDYRYGATGYLHWGFNWWRSDSSPYGDTVPHNGYLPGGDCWLVYPGKDGLIDSIRYEAMRDGIADYELLCMLAERDAEAAQRLAAKHILAFDKYNCDVDAFRATRRELLDLLAARGHP
jgi:hypothetical protein